MTVTGINEDGSIAAYDKGSEIALPPDQFPLIYVAFKFPAPGILIGRDPNAQINYDIWAAHNPDEIKAMVSLTKRVFGLRPALRWNLHAS